MRKEELITPFNDEAELRPIMPPSQPKKTDKLKQIYIVSLITNTFINFDHGIMPACTFKLKQELMIDDLFMGLLGSMVFMGLTSGSLVSGVLFTKYECKYLILFSLAMLVFCIIMFTFAEQNKMLLIVSRLISGFFQVFLVVYYPVWVDLFGGQNKTRWLSYLQIGVPFGVFLGYGFTAVLNILEKHFPWITVRQSYFSNTLVEDQLLPSGCLNRALLHFLRIH